MFKKKVQEEVVVEAKVAHFNPLSDPLCDGCGKPINTVQVREDGKQFHNQFCYNTYKDQAN